MHKRLWACLALYLIWVENTTSVETRLSLSIEKLDGPSFFSLLEVDPLIKS